MAKDPYLGSVVALLHGDSLLETISGTNSTTVSGNTTGVIDTSQKLFGSASLHYTDTNMGGKLPASSNWSFGTAPFTIEFSIYISGSVSTSTFIGTAPDAAGRWELQQYFGSLNFRFIDSGGNPYTAAAPDAFYGDNVNRWVSICIQRNASNVLTIWMSPIGLGYTVYNETTGFNHNVTTGSYLYFGPDNIANTWIDEVRITKGVARYTTSTYTVPTEAFPETAFDTFEDVLTDTATFQDTAGFNRTYLQIQSDTASAVDATGYVFGRPALLNDYATVVEPVVGVLYRPINNINETVTVADATPITLASLIADFAQLADSLGIKNTYTHAFAELVSVQERLSLGQRATIQDTASVAWALGVVQGAVLAERLGISEVLNYPIRYKLSAAETIRIYDALARFLNFDISETITASDTMSGLARHFTTLSQAATISETASPHFVLCATAADDAVLSDDFNVKMVFKPAVHEHITFTAMFASPSGGVTTWAVNTRTGAVTEYENYDFNSFAQQGNHYLGASSSGLYALDGDDDEGTSVIARIKSGFAQFGGSRFSSFKAAYLGLRGDGNIFLKLETGSGDTYTYKTVIQNQETTKVRLGKGLRARYFSFELITEGQDFDLDTVEFIPLVAQRRV